MILPVGEETDAVAGAEDVVEVILEMIERQIAIDRLGDLVGRQQVQRDACEHAERAQVNHSSEELVAVFLAREMQNLAVCGDDLQRRHGGCEVAVVQTRAMCSGGDSPGDRDMRQRCEIMQSVAARIDHRRQLAVFHACTHSDGMRLLVDLDLVEVLQRNLVRIAVGDRVERVARAESAQLFASLHYVLDLGDGGGAIDAIGAVGDVAGPVFAGRGLLLAVREPRQHGTCHDGS